MASALGGWIPLGRHHHYSLPQPLPLELEVLDHSACSEVWRRRNRAEGLALPQLGKRQLQMPSVLTALPSAQ